ncbi:ACT domain-containing protein [Propionibacteriaceae bacterium G1746]|uniref:ACT domain-containing protein n=1 Tax=Aestuariimicrobium sp. G57 TaxID=3418485 RepID=UPI003C236722
MMRVRLPDRPGSLGAVATALGTAGADINAIEIVERGPGFAINDFMLTMPPGALPDTLITACTGLDGVSVLWLSRYPENWGLASDIDTLNRMTAEPGRALQILTEAAPHVFHSQWALLLSPERAIETASGLAPVDEPGSRVDVSWCNLLAPLDVPHSGELPDQWLPGWGETTVAVAPAARGRTVVLGRQGGPEFLESELRRLAHLAALAL